MGIDSFFLDIVKEDPFVPKIFVAGVLSGEGVSAAIQGTFRDKERSDWDENDKRKTSMDGKAKSLHIMALPDDIYHSVINCQTTKEI